MTEITNSENITIGRQTIHEKKKKFVVCGGGSSAHTLIPLLQDSIFDVSIYTSKPDKWQREITVEQHDTNGNIVRTITGGLKTATDNPQEVIPTADYIVLCMPVHQYRVCLNNIAQYIDKEKTVFVGTIYGQGGFNWMIDEIKHKYKINNIVSFAFGLLPWICRIIEYGHIGITYGPKKLNYAACNPKSYFKQLNEELFDPITYRWFGVGHTMQSDNFLSLTLSVDNQIIHTSRCYGLYKVYGQTWDKKEDVPMFYKDYDQTSADLLMNLDIDYSKIRKRIIEKYPYKNFEYMLDYLALERFSYQTHNTDIIESFVNSQTLTSIATPVVQNNCGKWEIDRNHRFFLDDIYYGVCIAKWIAEKMEIEVPTIDNILHWAQQIRNEKIIDNENKLMLDSPDIYSVYKSGIPYYYGYNKYEDIID